MKHALNTRTTLATLDTFIDGDGDRRFYFGSMRVAMPLGFDPADLGQQVADAYAGTRADCTNDGSEFSPELLSYLHGGRPIFWLRRMQLAGDA